MRNLFTFLFALCILVCSQTFLGQNLNTFRNEDKIAYPRLDIACVNCTIPAPTIITANTTICKGESLTLTASSSACVNGVFKWTDGLQGNSITVSPSLTKSYRVLCKLNSVPVGNFPSMSDSSAAVKITVLPKPTQPKITASNSMICSGSSTVLTSTACTGGISTWTGGLIGSSITVSPTATKSYKVLCTQGTCKSDSSLATTITVITKPTQPKITASNATICLGGSSVLTTSACTGGTLTWTGGATGSSITVSPTATKSYKVLCTQGTCKSDSSLATTITVTPKPTQPKITASNSTICSGSSVTLTSTACTGGVLTWTGGVTGSLITVSPTSTKSYKVLCTQGTCKSDSSLATTITVIAKPTQPKITSSNSTICAGSSTTLTASACTGGVLTWTGGATGSSITVSPTSTKSYKVLCTQGTCKSDSSVATTITVTPKPTQPKITASNSTICLGGTTTLTSTACTGGTLTWAGGATGSSITVSPTATKSYKVLCTQGTCKSDSSVATTITVIAKPTQPKITASNSTICSGGSTVLTSTSCTGGVLTWTGGATGSSITVSPTATKSYKVLCTQGTCKSDSSVATTITVIAKPTQPKITASNRTICAGSSVTLNSTACTGGTLTWTGGATGSSIIVSPSVSKSYKVLCTQGTCKSDSSVAMTITVIAKPTQPKITASNSTICAGSSVTLNSTACTGGTLTWTGGATGSSITVSPTATKSYKVLCTQGACKSDSSVATTITVIAKPIQPKITASNSTICSGSSVTLTSTTCIGGVLIWTGGATGSSITVSPTVTKSYKVLCTQGTCKSDSSVATTITVTPKPTQPKITASNSTICSGGSTVLTSTACTGGTSTWTGGATGSSITVSPTVTKSYKVLCTQGTCKSDSSVATTITVTPKPTQPKITASNGTICAGSSTTLTSTACTGGTLTWTGGVTGSSITVSPSVTKSYKVLCTQGTCKSDSSVATTVTVIAKPAQPKITASNSTICSGSNVTLTSTACTGGTLTWTGGATGSSITVSPTATKSYKVLCTQGTCKSDSSVATTITVIAKPTQPKITANNSTICLGSSVTLTSSACTGGTLTWTGGATGSSITVSPSVTKSYKVLCTQGTCKSDSSLATTITVIAKPTQPKITASNGTICAGSSTTLTSTACTGGTLTWTGGATGSSITVSPTATKSYKVLCTQGTCKSDSSAAVTITVNSLPVSPKVTSNTICNNPVSVLRDISFGGENTDYLSSTCLSQDGSLVMVGNSISSNTGDKFQASKGGSDYWVVKVNAVGTKVWDKTFGGTGDDAPTSILATSDGGFLISGYSNSPKSGDKSEASKGGYDYWLVKIDANGTKVWDKSFGGSGSDYATTIIATTDNNFLITGHSDSGIGGNKSVGTKGSLDYWIVKIKPDGTKLWDKSYGGSGVDNLVSVVSTKEGGFLLAGHSSSLAGGDKTESSKGNYDYWVLKIDANGTKVWDKSYGALSQEELSSITPTFDGGFILGGISNSSIGGDKTEPLMGGFDYWIVKIDGNGTKLWDKVFGGSDTEYFAKVLPTADGGCLLGGTSYSPISGNKFEASLNGDFWLVKISANGSRAWDKVIGGNSADVLKDMFMGDNGTVILSGYSFSDIGINKSHFSKGSSDYWTVNAQVCDNSYKPYTNLVASGCTGVVTWSNNATGNTIAVSPAVSTNYTATCKVNGCLSSPSNVIAVSPAKPATPSIAASNTSICAGSSIVLSSSNSPNGIITWTGGLKGNSITISPTVTKTYKSICSINGINSDSSNSITITVIPQPTQPKITASNSTICQGSSTTLTASACTGGILTWTGGLTGSSITVSPTATKSYKVLCTQNYCKSDSSVATTITVTTKPQAPVISSKANYSSNNANAQWNKTFGGVGEENLTSIVSCADGGALLGGYSTSNVSADKSESSKGVYDYWVIRIDADGKKLWDKTLGGGNYDYLTSIVTTADGGFLLGGYSLSNKSGDKSENSKGDKDYWVVKIDKNGQKLWDKTYGGLFADVLTSITSTSDGGFLLGGHSLSYVGGDKTETNKGNNDYWVVKIDASGNKLWDKTFGGASYDYLYRIATTSDGGFLLGGYSWSNKSGDKSENIKGVYDYWIVKVDAKGNKVWDKTIGGDSGDVFSSLINTSDGGFLLAGYSYSNQSGDKSANAKGNADYWIVKIDASGNKLWDKTFGGNSLDQLNAVFKTSDGGFLLGGYSQSSINGDKTENTKGNYDYWVVRIDVLGNKLWDKTIGGNDNDQFSSMTLMKDGSFLLGGNSNSKASYDKSENAKGGFDYWLIKIKENQIKSTTSLTATGCTGTVNWSNGATGNSITVSPTVATTYMATCTVNTCKSVASNAITVSPDVISNGRIEVDVAIQPEPSFNFKVFPNPAKDELTIQTDLEGEATFYLYNSIGQKVLEKTFEKQTKIDVKNLSKGSHLYLIEHQEIKTNGKVLLE